jgi:hypothetical protein
MYTFMGEKIRLRNLCFSEFYRYIIQQRLHIQFARGAFSERKNVPLLQKVLSAQANLSRCGAGEI